jgi:NodT family efflux transporter outer membrane factor (OMF) lipoprotein
MSIDDRRPRRCLIGHGAGTASALAALMLAGCTVGPNFHRPRPKTTTSFLADRPPITAPNGVNQGKVDLRWWKSFHDPILTALETRAARQNLDIQASTERLAQAESTAIIQGAPFYPSLDFAGSLTREGPSKKGVFTALGGGGSNTTTSTNAGGVAGGGFGASGGGGLPGSLIKPFNLFQYGFSSVFDFDLWGKNRRALEAALAAVRASRDAGRAVLLNTEAQVAQDYIELRAEQTQLHITEANLRSARGIVGLSQQRANAGLENSLDVANLRAQAASVAAQIPPLRIQRDALINQLSLLLGEGPEALRAELITPRAVPPVPPSVPIGLPAELLRRRPDIREAEATLHEATAEVGVAVASFFPDVSLSGSVSLQALQLSNLNQLAAVTYAIGPQLTLPIFEGGRLRGTLRLRKAAQRLAAINYAKTVLTAFHQVDDALTAYDQEQNTLAALRVDVRESQLALNLAEQRYRQGLGSYLQVLTAEQSLLGAQQREAQSLETVSTDLVTLYQALGGGWEKQEPVHRKRVAAR